MISVEPDRPERRRLLRWWAGLLLFTTVAALLFSLRYFSVVDFHDSPGPLLFRAVMLIGHLATLSAVLLIPVLLLAVCWPRPRWVVAFGAFWTAGILLALLIDTQVYQLYRFHINAGVMNLLFGGAARATFIFPREMYLQAALIGVGVIVAVCAAAALLWRRLRSNPPRSLIARAAAIAIVASVVSFHGVHIWADVVAYEPFLEQTAVLPLRYAATAKRFLRARGVEVRQRQAEQLAFKADRTGLAYPLQPLECRAQTSAPNILFILVDSWRFDEMNEAVTPNIAQFAQRSVRFTDHHSGGNATRIGVFSLFYSIPGTYWHQMLNEQRGPVFIEHLLSRDYDMHVFRSAPLYSPEFDRTVFAQVRSPRLRSEGAGPADWDEDLTDDFIAFLRTRSDSSPFFALLFYDSPHSFQVPDDYPLVFQPSVEHVNYLRLDANTDETPLLNRYRNSLHYVDSLVGRALAEVEARGLLDDTIIVVTGDHGQEFNDSGRNFWGHGSNFTRYQTGVPLLVYSPRLAPRVIAHRTTHFDVAPTLLRSELGCTSPISAYSVGRSLFEPGGREPLVLSEYADFAIVQRDLIAVVRQHGMQIFGPDYTRRDVALDPAVTRAALEQKTRFYKSIRMEKEADRG